MRKIYTRVQHGNNNTVTCCATLRSVSVNVSVLNLGFAGHCSQVRSVVFQSPLVTLVLIAGQPEKRFGGNVNVLSIKSISRQSDHRVESAADRGDAFDAIKVFDVFDDG